MIEECMRNTYAVLTNKCIIEDILEDEPTSMFYGNPLNAKVEDIDEVISFYENTEEYEKCMELVYVKNDIIADGLTKKLIKDALYRDKR